MMAESWCEAKPVSRLTICGTSSQPTVPPAMNSGTAVKKNPRA